ncbi:ABC transporter permease [Bacillus spongiae]|uniref:ABC transporter permease n=1 Tax=Bacillus spongiae TaxID=2683610 RepID=A0ABU8H8U9_9BACI
MLNLVRNEWMKITKQTGTKVMIGLLILFVIITGGIEKSISSQIEQDRQQIAIQAEDKDKWKEELLLQIESSENFLNDPQLSKELTEVQKLYYEKDLAINTYRVENHLPEELGNNVWRYMDNSKRNGITMVGLFMIIVAAGIVANEFTWGTIKLLLIRPTSRFQILLSKYITVLSFGLMLLGILFVISALVGFVLFGSPSGNNVHLAYVDGNVIEEPMAWFIIKDYLLSLIGVLMTTTMAFMISTLFRNSPLAIGVALTSLLVGELVVEFLALSFDWTKYILFANTDLTTYTQLDSPLVQGMTLEFSIAVLAVYFIIFIVLAFIPFMKRDVGA